MTAPQDADLRIGKWRISPALDRISSAEGELHLEPKVMDVLVVLARHAGRVVSKDEILDAVWPDTAIADGALFRYVSLLRQALGDDRRQPRYIETIPKRGYRLIAPVSCEPPARRAAVAPARQRAPLAATGRWRRLIPWAVAAVATGVAVASRLPRDRTAARVGPGLE